MKLVYFLNHSSKKIEGNAAMKEAIEEILAAEKRCREKIAEARRKAAEIKQESEKKASAIVSDASEKAARIIEEKTTIARKEAEAVRKQTLENLAAENRLFFEKYRDIIDRLVNEIARLVMSSGQAR